MSTPRSGSSNEIVSDQPTYHRTDRPTNGYDQLQTRFGAHKNGHLDGRRRRRGGVSAIQIKDFEMRRKGKKGASSIFFFQILTNLSRDTGGPR